MSDELPIDLSGGSATEAPAPAVEKTERDPYDVAMERVAAIKVEMVQLRKDRDAATNRMNKLQEEETELLRRFSVGHERSHIENQKAIMNHLRKQNEVRMARAGRHQQAKASGYSAEDLRGKSVLDAAMSRNTSRGTQRPTVS